MEISPAMTSLGCSLFVAAALVAAAFPLAGGVVPPRPLDLSALESPFFTAFTTRDGLPDSVVGALATDAEGFVWAGTIDGLYRYDGHRWERVEAPGVEVSAPCLFLDRSGTLWTVLAEGGLAWLDRSGWHAEGRDTGLESDRFARVLELPDGEGGEELWVLSEDSGLFLRVGDRWRADPGNPQLQGAHLQAAARTSEIGGADRLWVATYGFGLFRAGFGVAPDEGRIGR